jgi:hypothetical protein
MPPEIPGQIWNRDSNVMVLMSAAGAKPRVLPWHAPDSHVWVRVVFPSDGYDVPVWEVFVAVSSRFDDPSRLTCDGRYHSISDWAMYPHREYTYHSGSIGPPELPPKSSPNTSPASGVFAPDAADSGPVPNAFDALAVNVYAVELVSPVTVHWTYVFPLEPVIDPADPAATVVGDWALAPMYGVTVHDVMEPPPLDDGARKLTVAPASFVMLVTFAGALGTFPAAAAAG